MNFLYTRSIVLMALPLFFSAGSEAGTLFSSVLFSKNQKLCAERYTKIPVRKDAIPKTVMFIAELPRPSLGTVWDIRFEVHATNDDLRKVGKGVYLSTEVRLSNNVSHDRDGIFLLRANGAQNISVKAHHHLASRSKIVQFDEGLLSKIPEGPLYLKLVLKAGSTAALSGDFLDITACRGFFQVFVL